MTKLGHSYYIYIMLVQSNNAITIKRLIFLAGLFFIINVMSSGGHFDSWDGIETFLVTESMVLKHSAKLYPDVPSIQGLSFDIHHSVAVNEAIQTGRSDNLLKPMYTARSLLLSAIAVPFYYAATIFSVSPMIVVALFVNSMIISLISVVIFYFSLEIYKSKRIAFVLSLIFGVCSFVWPYHDSLFPQPLEALLIFTSAFFIYMSAKSISNNTANSNKAAIFASLGGLLLGFSLFAHPSSIIVIPGVILYSILLMRRNRKSLSSFFIALGIILSFAGLVNYWRFGSFTEFGYGPYASLSQHQGWKGLIGLLVSPGEGLIFYFPIIILLPIALKNMYKENKALFYLSAYLISVSWLYFGTISYAEPSGWSGGGWGPRYLIPTLPFITLVSGTLLLHLKANKVLLRLSMIIVLCVAGFSINLLGVLVWYMYGYSYGWAAEELWKLESPNNVTRVKSMDLMTWNPDYSPIILHMKALKADYVSTIKSAPGYTMIGLAPCSYNNFLFCKFGIMPLYYLSAVTVMIAIIILMEMSTFRPRFFALYLKSTRKILK